jgi:hypothetical protein
MLRLEFGPVPTVWYVFVFLEYGPVPTVSVVYVFVFLEYGPVPTVGYVFVFLEYGPVPTVWYVFVFLEYGPVPTVGYVFVFHLIVTMNKHCSMNLTLVVYIKLPRTAQSNISHYHSLLVQDKKKIRI